MPIEIEKLYMGFISGAEEVMANKNYLNTINVFPVADGDTGSNLFSTMHSIVTYSELKTTAKHTLESIADSAITGARGNSGLIFAQYFQGLSESIDTDELTAQGFISASSNGMKYAFEAVEHPVEGTILTIMRVFHESLIECMAKTNNFMTSLESAYEKVVLAVEHTTKQLLVLKKSSVVDSGAKGFAYFLKGFINGLKGHKQAVRKPEEDIEIVHLHDDDFNFRYCTEALLQNSEVITKEELSHFGDSLIVAAGKTKTRLHIHTDDPVMFFDYLSGKGSIIEQKVDDMYIQHERVHHQKYNRVIITDSIADIPKSLLDDEQVHMIPLSILIGESSYFDKLTINNELIFKLSKQLHVHPTTSQPTIKTVKNAFEYLLTYYDEIIVLTVAKALSGTHQVFKNVSKKYDNIYVIDSKQNSVAQGLLLHETMMDLKEGVATAKLLMNLNDRIENSKILVQVKSLDPMIASGRLSVKLGSVLKRIGVKPIITLDKNGEGSIFKITLNNKQSYKRIIKHIKTTHEKLKIAQYAITYIDDDADANRFASDIEKVTGLKPTYVTKSSSIIAVGAGTGAVGIGYITERNNS